MHCRMAAQAPYPAYGLAWFCRPDKRSAIRQFSGTVLIAGWRRTALSGLRFGWGV